ncbi:flagellar biosynthetic protein FliQ [Candidatus Poribacteria bacterium]|nr:MAG: flagellar biosynthetic protein FliQ [Candidatus Poribacteria bacterium]
MELGSAVYILTQAVKLVLIISAPVLLACLAVGVVVSLLQAITQIQEITLSFIPKILAAFVTLAILFPWMLKMMMSFTKALLENVDLFLR